jgi:hypothetical protein
MRKFATLFLLIIAGNLFAQKEIHFKNEGNPLVKHIYTADPSAHVFNGRLYVYTSHDENDATYFDMLDWHVFSTDNLVDWIDHGLGLQMLLKEMGNTISIIL